MSEVFTYKNLYRAYLNCRAKKRKTVNALKFEYNLETNLKDLLSELKNKTYRPGRSIRFIATKPKPREIFAADFRDRVTHHLLIGEILPYAEKKLIYDSYACRAGKGTHKAVERISRIFANLNQDKLEPYFMQLDIKTFFPSIDKNILFEIVKKFVLGINRSESWKADILWLSECVIFHDPSLNYYYKGDQKLLDLIPREKSLVFQSKNKGLPIGNYTSQFLANLYLNELDQFIKRDLRCRYYVRYVDDLILVGSNRKRFHFWEKQISDFLKIKLVLKVNERKTCVRPARNGLDFLGYFIKSDYMLVRRRVAQTCREKVSKGIFDTGQSDRSVLKKIVSVVNSYLGHFAHAESFGLRRETVWRVLQKAPLLVSGETFCTVRLGV